MKEEDEEECGSESRGDSVGVREEGRDGGVCIVWE